MKPLTNHSLELITFRKRNMKQKALIATATAFAAMIAAAVYDLRQTYITASAAIVAERCQWELDEYGRDFTDCIARVIQSYPAGDQADIKENVR